MSGDRRALIERLYAAREAEDAATIVAALAQGATFRLVATERLFPGVPTEPVDAAAAIQGLMEQYRFDNVELVDVLIDGAKAAVHSRMTASFQGGPPAVLELLDVWTFDDQGRISGMVEFGDTGLAAAMMTAAHV